MNTFNNFEKGTLVIGLKQIDLADIAWIPHATFEGVTLKHLVTASQTEGCFSYHLVHIESNKKIGLHVHETQLETHEVIAGKGLCLIGGRESTYEPGVISLIPRETEHEIKAFEDGLYLFAKFLPALC